MKAVSDFFKKHYRAFIAMITVSFFILFSLSKSGKEVEYSFYDSLLRLKPAPKERKEILLLNIDDLAIEQLGSWPWTRDIIGDALLRLRELGGKTAVFDIEYLSPGQTGLNKDYVENEFPAEYEKTRAEVSDYIMQFSAAIAEKNIALGDVLEFGNTMKDDLDMQLGNLSSSIRDNIFRDNDAYFGKAVGFFGNTFLTINAVNVNLNTEDAELKKFAYDNFLYDTISDPAELIKKETIITRQQSEELAGISPTIYPILQYAQGAGFPNVIIDTDGVRRRIQLLNEYNGKYLAQLVFSPILHILKPEQIVRTKRSIILKNCTHPDYPGKKDIKIPLDENGYLLINWLKKRFLDTENPSNGSFKSMSVYALLYADKIEKNLLDNLHQIKSLKIQTSNGYLQYDAAVQYLLDRYEKIQQSKQALLAGTSSDYDLYFQDRADFFQNINELLNGDFEAEIHTLFAQVKSETGSNKYDAFDASVGEIFTAAKNNYDLYVQNIATAKEKCADSFAIIGYSGVGTSDLGVNPFWASYPNVGTHANIYNTIMNEDFIRPIPRAFSIILAVILVMLTAFVLSKVHKVFFKMLFGFLTLTCIFAISVLLFSFGGLYVQTLVIAMSVLLCFLAISIFDFVFAEKEKSFLRKAFGVYLSKNVVDEIVKDPSKLALGGEEKRITALFTDIRSFSTLSEKVTPTHLVKVLNEYLTLMSDLILSEGGTVDKYIGDAIVSFFGAPLEVPDHAKCACRAAIKMKAAEAELNKKLYESGDIPMPINTRIGINTGQMVVGNMGTESKMNYTIMGNDVNLASRLEGVNKMYATWILVSENTWNDTKGEFLGRRLDRVRVVGINTPVQLYNVMGEKAAASESDLALVRSFETGIDQYRNKDFQNALRTFENCLTIKADDGPARYYAEKIRELLANPELAAKHDDIVNMTKK